MNPPVLTPPTGFPAHGDPEISIPAPRMASEEPAGAPPPAAPPGRAAADPAICVCGHSAETHEHLRRGSDCGACGPDVCAAYRRRGGRLRRVLRALRARAR
ncbi:hypothetical protein [Pseudonocardia asaccharolytica]|uniref:hypothetical protein n=1 Tax=Pseudonocardia asaccharolytica TaxID=54010 RepID=UPI00049004E5|nr:hypothetical protein [Pseudonocardia asaccharolytica]